MKDEGDDARRRQAHCPFFREDFGTSRFKAACKSLNNRLCP
jgi:hypothetical protein